eukprot:m.9915 g.9915  ORF g.9915 m.9915 type:complete len:133 (-) comp5505_c0_seq1:1666-2064(-)
MKTMTDAIGTPYKRLLLHSTFEFPLLFGLRTKENAKSIVVAHGCIAEPSDPQAMAKCLGCKRVSSNHRHNPSPPQRNRTPLTHRTTCIKKQASWHVHAQHTAGMFRFEQCWHVNPDLPVCSHLPYAHEYKAV